MTEAAVRGGGGAAAAWAEAITSWYLWRREGQRAGYSAPGVAPAPSRSRRFCGGTNAMKSRISKREADDEETVTQEGTCLYLLSATR